MPLEFSEWNSSPLDFSRIPVRIIIIIIIIIIITIMMIIKIIIVVVIQLVSLNW